MDACTKNTENWQFEIGSMVTHRDQPMPSLVMMRARSSKGHEIYGVRRQEECEVPDLMTLGQVLVAA